MTMFGLLIYSLFLFGILFLGSFVIIRLILFLLAEALSCNLAPFCGFFLFCMHVNSFIFFLNESQLFSHKKLDEAFLWVISVTVTLREPKLGYC